MEQSDFRDAAQILSGQITIILGWRPHEFWDATPAEISSLMSSRQTRPMDRGMLDDLIKNDAQIGKDK